MNIAESKHLDRPAKIHAIHLDRLAIVYVRQSHPQQVQRHRESAQVQANLRLRALQWGWPAERIHVLDGDQGCSGTTTVGRDDFDWLASEIVLDHVGIVFGFQINRLAREDETCCRLIRVCAAFNTLLADEDGVYHPLDFNDRLLLTIKGVVGGIELHQIQQRMQAGRLNRARRGEWMGQPPPGYIVGPDAKLQFDPDEQVQYVVRLTFEQFTAQGSLCGLLRYLQRHQVQLPYRPAHGADKGQLQWHAPQRETLRQLLRHPAYAGVYTWGRRGIDPGRVKPGHRSSGRIERPAEKCAVVIRENHAAYISWDQHQNNITNLRRHRRHGPVPGRGRTTAGMLAGLVVCGRCGCRMLTHYSRTLRYTCQRRALDYAESPCQSFGGRPLEDLVGQQVLEVLTPAGLELSRRAAEECEQQREEENRRWRLRLERAGQDTARAFRQYNAVEPENRLVARTLERRWEEALLAERTLNEEYDRFRQQQPVRLSVAEREQIEALACEFPLLWRSPRTSVEEKRQVIRLLVHQVVVWTSKSSQELKVQLHWSGGVMTEHQLNRTVRSWEQVSDANALWMRVQEWQVAGWTSQQMAEGLNAAGYRTPHGHAFTAESVRQMVARGGPRRAGKGKRPKHRQPSRRAKAATSRESSQPLA